jgi:hypothetical protein
MSILVLRIICVHLFIAHVKSVKRTVVDSDPPSSRFMLSTKSGLFKRNENVDQVFSRLRLAAYVLLPR